MATSSGIQIKVDSRYVSSGPILVHVTMVADMPTYYANNGILDKAMEVVLVRRDAPGTRLLAKLDPHLHMQPDTPLPPPIPGKEPSGFISEERVLDVLGYGAHHDGRADYFVVGVFAGCLSDPQQTSVEDHDQYRRLPAGAAKKAPPYMADAGKPLLSMLSGFGMVARAKADPEVGVEGAFRVRQQPDVIVGEQQPSPFVTIIAARIDPRGGVSSGSFLVDSTDDQLNRTGQFFIPSRLLTPQPTPGRYLVLVFSGDHQARSFEMEVV
jgi:hypothetical protein